MSVTRKNVALQFLWYLSSFLGLFQVGVNVLQVILDAVTRRPTVQQQLLKETFPSLSLSRKVSVIDLRHPFDNSKQLTIIRRMKLSRTCGAKSMEGALVKLSTMKRNTAAARRKLSTDPSSPSSVPRSSLVPICVWRAPRLKRTHAFSNATVRWALGTPVRESYLSCTERVIRYFLGLTTAGLIKHQV